MDPKNPNRATPDPANEGEGNKAADKNYREGVEKFERENDPERVAREAARDLDEDAPETRRADEAGRGKLANAEFPEGEN